MILYCSSVDVAHTCPVVIPKDPCACYLIELLQLEAAYLTDLAIIDFDLGVVAKDNYHLK